MRLHVLIYTCGRDCRAWNLAGKIISEVFEGVLGMAHDLNRSDGGGSQEGNWVEETSEHFEN